MSTHGGHCSEQVRIEAQQISKVTLGDGGVVSIFRVGEDRPALSVSGVSLKDIQDAAEALGTHLHPLGRGKVLVNVPAVSSVRSRSGVPVIDTEKLVFV